VEEGRGNRREFRPIEATVLVVGCVLLAVLDSFARDGVEVWRMFWLFQSVVHIFGHWQGCRDAQEELSGPSWRRDARLSGTTATGV
jgi:hypothetical protein